jgi:hypothetical protein
MKYTQIDFFSMIVESLISKPGTHLFIFMPDEELCDVYTFDSKDDFDKEFETKEHPYYPSRNTYIPRNILSSYDDGDYDCIIDNEKHFVSMRYGYLIVDGKRIT